MPDCRMDVFYDEEEADDPTLVGENCHIVAENNGGPRADPAMPLERRNSYSNLILLCRNHHRIIDDLPNGPINYPVARLQQIKTEHEQWVRQQLEYDANKQQDDEAYAQIVDGWEKHCHVDDWLAWSSSILCFGQPTMKEATSNDLSRARRWMLTRIWPNRYNRLEAAFSNFRLVLEDFHNTFQRHTELVGSELRTRKFYRDALGDQPREDRLLAQYEHHVDLVQDLMLELSRAANWICSEARSSILNNYRRNEGHLVVQSGPFGNLQFVESVVQYTPEELEGLSPYRGLNLFLNDRGTRDSHYGEGAAPA